MRRLSIIDLRVAPSRCRTKTPAYGRYAGEIYNFKELWAG
jgi:hypothetical protein